MAVRSTALFFCYLCPMEEKKLYPMRLRPIVDEYSWGSEEFKIADLGYRDSSITGGWLGGNTMGELMDTYMDRVVGENVYEYYGRQFPICIRQLHISGKYPIQVHPDDTVSRERYDFLGKEKLWIVLSAGKGAMIYLGFKDDSSPADIFSKTDITSILNGVAPHEGQSFIIEPGTIYGAKGPIEILEISQSSPLDFLVSAQGEEVSQEQFDPSLNLTEALDFINFKAWKATAKDYAPKFSVNPLNLIAPVKVSTGKFDSFIIYYSIAGDASIEAGGETFTLKQGNILLVPSDVEEFTLVPNDGKASIIEILMPHRDDPDSYVGRLTQE